ncbi:MAG: winged helix-turn-helix transcriptional regulator [Thermomicrobiales bacterium]
MKTRDGRSGFCPVYHYAIELIGRRWTGAILRALHSGEIRFSEVTATVPGLSDRLLSERLKELEAEGIVTRTVIPDTPVRIEYHLTEKGQALGQVMEEIALWAEEWVEPAPAAQQCAEAEAKMATAAAHG